MKQRPISSAQSTGGSELTDSSKPDLKVIPVVEEQAVVRKRKKLSEGVRVRTVLHTAEEVIDEPLAAEDIEVERTPLDRWVDAPVPVRHEGDTTVVTLVEEVVVVEKRLRATEEIRIIQAAVRSPRAAAGHAAPGGGGGGAPPASPKRRQSPLRGSSARCSAPGLKPHNQSQMEILEMTTDTTIVSSFDDKTIAGKAMKALQDEGFRQGDIKILQGGTDTLVSELVKRGFDEDEARGFADAAEQGKTLLAALVSEDKADHAASIMDRFEAAQDEAHDKESGPDKAVQIVEEELVVGKDKLAIGGVRVTSSVEERPVEETVTLREERVSAEERPADRELSAEEAEAAFEEKTVEALGTTEEAKVSKKARVVGEVAVNKAVEEREETVRDTVRKTDVDIEEVGTKARKGK